jgi:mannosyltransferase
MRILYLTNNPNLGSTARILQCWLPMCPGEGLAGYVVAPPASKLLPWLAEHDVPHLADPMPWPDRRWPLPGLWHAWRVARWAGRNFIDVIHCNEHDLYPFAMLLRRFLRRPMVCHVRYRVERGFAEWAFAGRRTPDALLWTSRQQQSDSAAAVDGLIPEERQYIVPLGIDLSTFGTRAAGRDAVRQSWGVQPDSVVIGQATALRPRKRIEDFIDLVARLARTDERVVGVLAGDIVPGDEPYREKVRQHIEAAGLGQRFIWLGNLDDVEPFYHAIDVSVSTSEYETFGNSVCEAMSCGKPVAAYSGGSVEEIVGGAGRIVRTGDLAALEASVGELAARPELRAALGSRGRQRVADCFNPRSSLRQLAEIYRTIIPATNTAERYANAL